MSGLKRIKQNAIAGDCYPIFAWNKIREKRCDGKKSLL